ncbi:hypothetical protein EDC52_102293 [Biostraticola tofi]|uniref:Uncharacterized protein n=1 Tax=Biostraticola tofi TaxID=466109 RepID=A0A4R3Z060_9GAMM|nr:hypothetical protein EDC52_102293 [Biostraticola tofi]
MMKSNLGKIAEVKEGINGKDVFFLKIEETF